jgi:hypothetical protein
MRDMARSGLFCTHGKGDDVFTLWVTPHGNGNVCYMLNFPFLAVPRAAWLQRRLRAWSTGGDWLGWLGIGDFEMRW